MARGYRWDPTDREPKGVSVYSFRDPIIRQFWKGKGHENKTGIVQRYVVVSEEQVTDLWRDRGDHLYNERIRKYLMDMEAAIPTTEDPEKTVMETPETIARYLDGWSFFDFLFWSKSRMYDPVLYEDAYKEERPFPWVSRLVKFIGSLERRYHISQMDYRIEVELMCYLFHELGSPDEFPEFWNPYSRYGDGRLELYREPSRFFRAHTSKNQPKPKPNPRPKWKPVNLDDRKDMVDLGPGCFDLPSNRIREKVDLKYYGMVDVPFYFDGSIPDNLEEFVGTDYDTVDVDESILDIVSKYRRQMEE